MTSSKRKYQSQLPFSIVKCAVGNDSSKRQCNQDAETQPKTQGARPIQATIHTWVNKYHVRSAESYASLDRNPVNLSASDRDTKGGSNVAHAAKGTVEEKSAVAKISVLEIVPAILDEDQDLADEQLDTDSFPGVLEPTIEGTSTPPALSDAEVASYFQSLRVRVRQSLGSICTEIESLRSPEPEPRFEEDIRNRFNKFRTTEAALSGWNPAYLVTPSGNPRQCLHLKLNYPTFRTSCLEYGQSADETNNSTRLLMQKGLSASNAFWYEACFRRQAPTRNRHQEAVTKHWPTEVKDAHADFSRSCEALEKKVLLLFGAPNRKDLNQRYDIHETVVKVSNTETVTVGIVRRPNGKLQFVVVYCPHPEWLVWNWTIWAGRYYDACINLAAVLSGLEVCPNWFEARAKRVKVIATEKNALRDADTTRKLEKQNRVRCHPRDLPETVRIFATENGFPEERLHKHFDSGRSVAQMVFEVVQSRQPVKSSWNNGVRMPRNMPRNIPAQVRSGFGTHLLQNQPNPPNDFGIPAPASANICIVPNKTKSKNPVVKTAVIHLGLEIQLMCIRCGVAPRSKPIDCKPTFVTISAAKGKYIAQRQACTTPACNPTKRKGQVDQFMIPQDPNVPFIRSDNLSKVEVPKNAKDAE